MPEASTIEMEIEIRPGETLRLPDEVTDRIGVGHWRVTIEPVTEPLIRNHAAFLRSYAPEDEGLYDDV